MIGSRLLVLLRAHVLLLCMAPQTSQAIKCKKTHVKYSSGQIPPFAGSTGPFGTVCEVQDGSAFPSPPQVPAQMGKNEVFVVRSTYPSTFLEESRGVQHTAAHVEEVPKTQAQTAGAAGSIDCGSGMTVGNVGASMNEKVYGISGDWMAGCVACGENLQLRGRLKTGWFCQEPSSWLPTGVWLKRLGDSDTPSTIRVDVTNPGHEIIGFGGAFTDAAAIADELLGPGLRSAWRDAYYGPAGLGYTIGRVHFGGCDFSRKGYSLDDVAGDLNLTHMCLRDDRENATCGQDAKLPIIKSVFAKEPNMKLFFSPWSAPAWMKTSGKLVGGRVRGLGAGQWSAEDKLIAQAWARSYVAFADLYSQEGIPLWGLTLQNEPGADQYVSWNSNALKGDDELDLLRLVGPLMREKYPHLKIMVHDDQVYALIERLVEQGKGILESEYMDGVAFHWYGTQAGLFENTTAQHVVKPIPIGPKASGGGIEVKTIYDKYISGKKKFMLGTEAYNGFMPKILQTLVDPYSSSNNRGVRPGDWWRGYRYSRDIFTQLVNGASGWVDWNLLLRSDGGPNWAGNNVDAPILVSPDAKALWVSPMYFHLAHWAKYVVPGSRVLPVEHMGGDLHEVAAFLRPDGRVVIVALSDQLDGHGDPPANQMLKVLVGGQELHLDMPSSSIVTAVLDVAGEDNLFV